MGSKKQKKSVSDLPENITRRDFIGATLLGAGSALLYAKAPAVLRSAQAQSPLPYALLDKNWTGPGGIGDYANSNGNTHEVVNAAHSIRDGYWKEIPADLQDTGEEFDLVIVGGGITGLMSAYEFIKQQGSDSRVLILDNHPVFGGEAKHNKIEADGYQLTAPQGSNMFLWPPKTAEMYGIFYHPVWRELGMPMGDEDDAPTWVTSPTGTTKELGIGKDNFTSMMIARDFAKQGYYFPDQDGKGKWVINAWENEYNDTPWPEEVKAEFRKMDQFLITEPTDPHEVETWLDSMTYKDFLINVVGVKSKEIFDFLNPLIAAHAPGLGCDVISALAAKHFFSPGTTTKAEYEEEMSGPPPELGGASFPGGNTGIARHFVKRLIPDAIKGKDSLQDIIYDSINWDALDRPGQSARIRLNSTVVDVRHNDSIGAATGTYVTYINNETGKPNRVKGKTVIMAGGQWTNKHILRDCPNELKAAMDEFHHAPMMIINVAVRHWRFMEKLGISSARWFDGFGWFTNVRAPMSTNGKHAPLDPDKPTVLTFYMPFTDGVSDRGIPHKAQTILSRNLLFNMSFREIEEKIREQLTKMFGEHGFDDKRDIAGIITNRWGHAYVVPQPGFYHGKDGNPAPGKVLRKGYGRIRFAHSELSGVQLWTTACEEGERAAKQVAEIV